MLPKPVIQEKTDKDGVEKENKVLKDKSKTTAKSPKPKVKKETPVKGQKQEVNPKTEGKRARLIVRNLAFKVRNYWFNIHNKIINILCWFFKVYISFLKKMVFNWSLI